MSKLAIIAVATTYTFKDTEVENVTSVEALLSAFNLRTIAPMREFTFDGKDYKPFYFLADNDGLLTALQALFNAPAPALPDGFIVGVWDENGSQDINYPLNAAAYLEAMPDDVDANDVRTRPTVIKSVIKPNSWPVLDLTTKSA